MYYIVVSVFSTVIAIVYGNANGVCHRQLQQRQLCASRSLGQWLVHRKNGPRYQTHYVTDTPVPAEAYPMCRFDPNQSSAISAGADTVAMVDKA